MKKSEIYVELNDKNREKVFEILDMFGEELNFDDNICRHTLRYESGDSIDDYPTMIFYDGYWYLCKSIYGLKKTKVKPRELRNMLAQEHLKEGDVVVVGNDWGRWVLELNGHNLDRFEHHSRYSFRPQYLKTQLRYQNWITDGNFIRYATEEERKLLQPVVFECASCEQELDVSQRSDDKPNLCNNCFKHDIISVPIDKFSELKQAHKNGAVIPYRNPENGAWFTLPPWAEGYEYLIKPEEPKTIDDKKLARYGDVCKFYNINPGVFVVGYLAYFGKAHNNKVYYCVGLDAPFNNAEPITKEEAIKLLFGNDK